MLSLLAAVSFTSLEVALTLKDAGCSEINVALVERVLLVYALYKAVRMLARVRGYRCC